jgi:HSP20 family protein
MGTTPEAVEIYAFAPGIDASKLEVSVDKGLLTISGERPTGLPEDGGKTTVFARERFDGAFKRAVSLPEDVDTAKVEAEYRNGILRITVPKAQAYKPRRVEVRS